MKNVEWRMKNERKRIPTAIIVGIFLLLDQAMKYLFSDSARAYCNDGGPWGVGIGNGVMTAMMAAILGVAGYSFWKRGISFPPSHLADSTLSLGRRRMGAIVFILGGGLSNLLDRIFFGCVRDFVLVSWFPALNLADVFLTVGAIFFLLSFIAGNERERPEHS